MIRLVKRKRSSRTLIPQRNQFLVLIINSKVDIRILICEDSHGERANIASAHTCHIRGANFRSKRGLVFEMIHNV